MNRLLGHVHLDHPGHFDRERGAVSRAYLVVDRGLKSGRTDEVELTEDALLALIESAAKAVLVLRGRK